MNVQVKCNSCRKNLVQKDVVSTTGLDAITISVVPCGNIDCNNCTGCEDVKDRNQLREELKTIKEKLARIVTAEGKNKLTIVRKDS